MMTLHEHLGQLVRLAPPGTLVPVDSLAELLRTYSPEKEREAGPAGLSLGEVAERFTRVVGGERKTVQEGTVRNWIRIGLRGVRLKAFRVGRYLRVLEPDFEAFVDALAAQSRLPMEGIRAMDSSKHPQHLSPEDELEAYLVKYRPEGSARAGTQRNQAASSAPAVVGRNPRRRP